jgi:G3E family GTPase
MVRTPVLIVSGFLGAGKTTLVRHLLHEAQEAGIRLAIVSNEFGELGIDKALLGGSSEVYVELGGGCVCCQLSNELVDTLQMLHERVRPDRIVIETSGVALPFDVHLHLGRDPVRHWVGDDLVVVVVDAEQLRDERDLAGTFEDQVTSADLLILNKLDLVSPDRLAEIEARLRTIEPEAPLVHAEQGDVDPIILFPPDAEVVRRQRSPAPELRPHEHLHEAFTAAVVEVDEGTAPDEIERRFAALGALRVKGFVRTPQGLRVVQGVGSRVEVSAAGDEPPPELIGKVVVIRRGEDSGRPTHGGGSTP